jgi:transposase InsO family protein
MERDRRRDEPEWVEREDDAGSRGLPARRSGGVINTTGRGRRTRRTTRPESGSQGRVLAPEERLLLLDVWLRSKLPAREFGALTGITSSSLYAWKKKFEAEGPAGLLGHKRGSPKGSRLPEPTKRAILMLKGSHPDWGRDRIRDELVRAEGLDASAGAIGKVLEEEGYVVEESPTRPRPQPPRRFERARPNQLWQSDIFSFGLKRSGRRVHLVVFLDDHSRFVVGFGLHATASAALVKEAFEAAATNFGLPEEVLTDRGPQYATWRGKSAFTKLLERRGVKHLLARPRHPQTLGKTERFWQTLWRECAEVATFRDLEDARRRVALYLDHYNFARPHRSLDGLVPADRFFDAAQEVKEALSRQVAENALELARGGLPRKPLYLAGRVGGESIALHGEEGRVVLLRGDAVREEVDLEAQGRRSERGESASWPATVAAHRAPRDPPATTTEPEPRPGRSMLDEALEGAMGSGDEEARDGGEEEAEQAQADRPEDADRQRGGDAAQLRDLGDDERTGESGEGERGVGGVDEPLLPAGDEGVAGADRSVGAEEARTASDAGPGPEAPGGGERPPGAGASALPGVGAHGAAHDRACQGGPGEGRIEGGASAAGAGPDGAEDASGASGRERVGEGAESGGERCEADDRDAASGT